MDGDIEFQEEPTFRDLVRLLRSGLVVALAVGVGAAILTYVLTKRLAPTYQATATVLASQPDSALQQFGVSLVTAPTVDVTAYEAAATSNPVVTTAMQSLGTKDPTEKQIVKLLKKVSVRVDSGQKSSLLHIDVKNVSPVMAASTANALANALLAWDKQRATQNLGKIVDALQGQITSLDAQIAQTRAAELPTPGQVTGLESLRAQRTLQLNSARALEDSAVGSLEILEPAIAPIQPVSPRPGQDAALAFVLGLLLVYAVVFLRNALDTRFRGTEDLARTTSVPVLAEFPRLASGVRHLPHEAANYLRTNVTFATSQDHPKVILVTSASPKEGKTSVAMSLAESFARNDYSTLLVDGDLRKPEIGTEYHLAEHSDASLRAMLEDPDRPHQPVCVALGHTELHVIPSFAAAPSPTELLAGGFASLLSRLRDSYDVIVVDSPPVLPVADALTMAPHCTGVVFAVSLAGSERGKVKAALNLLERIGVRLMGLVATNVAAARSGRGEYGYGVGYGHEEPAAPRGAAADEASATKPFGAPAASIGDQYASPRPIRSKK